MSNAPPVTIYVDTKGGSRKDRVVQPDQQVAGMDALIVPHQHRGNVTRHFGTDDRDVTAHVGVIGVLHETPLLPPMPAIENQGDPGHGRAFRFEDPFGHVFEIYCETVRHAPSGDDVPALKNTASAFTGAAPRRIDHLNLLCDDVAAFRRFMETCLGSRVT